MLKFLPNLNIINNDGENVTQFMKFIFYFVSVIRTKFSQWNVFREHLIPSFILRVQKFLFLLKTSFLFLVSTFFLLAEKWEIVLERSQTNGSRAWFRTRIDITDLGGSPFVVSWTYHHKKNTQKKEKRKEKQRSLFSSWKRDNNTYLFTRRIHQDIIKNPFLLVTSLGSFCMRLPPTQFVCAFKKSTCMNYFTLHQTQTANTATQAACLHDVKGVKFHSSRRPSLTSIACQRPR